MSLPDSSQSIMLGAPFALRKGLRSASIRRNGLCRSSARPCECVATILLNSRVLKSSPGARPDQTRGFGTSGRGARATTSFFDLHEDHREGFSAGAFVRGAVAQGQKFWAAEPPAIPIDSGKDAGIGLRQFILLGLIRTRRTLDFRIRGIGRVRAA